MAAEEQIKTFGRYLQAIRLEKGLGLEQISQQTRISVDVLHLLEREDLGNLPAEVFVKGFVRAYARTLGVDADEAVHRYVVAIENNRQEQLSEAAIVQDRSRFWLKLLVAMSLLVAIVGLTMVAVHLFHPEAPSTPSAPGENPPAAAPKTDTLPASEQASAAMPSLPPAPASPPPVGADAAGVGKPTATHKYQLTVEGLHTTHLKVIVDDRSAENYTLEKGDRLVLEAQQGYNLLLDNATGVRISLNGKPVILKGKEGQMVTRQLP